MTKIGVASVFVFFVLGAALPAAAQVDQQRAQEFFKEAQALCERDGGRLWGVSLCGPMVIADARTQTLATSQPAPTEARPRALGFANAPMEWGGASWVGLMWDFTISQPPRERRQLFLHELFHRVQSQLGLVVQTSATEHLDVADGRYWLFLEWRALARALGESAEPRRRAVADALAFRAARRTAFPDRADTERATEIVEGLAHYTGTVLAATSVADAVASGIDGIDASPGAESIVRTWAPTSGVLYGLLLDQASPGWTRQIRGTDDLGSLLMRALGVQQATDVAAAAARYDGAALRASEERRDQQREQRIAELRKQFVDGPVLMLPGGGSAASDARGATVIPGVGTVYFGSFRASGPWGTPAADKGVLVASDGRSRRVAAPARADDTRLSGDGWSVTVAAGWVIRGGDRRGDYQVVPQPR